jgi:hypothetical protein
MTTVHECIQAGVFSDDNLKLSFPRLDMYLKSQKRSKLSDETLDLWRSVFKKTFDRRKGNMSSSQKVTECPLPTIRLSQNRFLVSFMPFLLRSLNIRCIRPRGVPTPTPTRCIGPGLVKLSTPRARRKTTQSFSTQL